MEIPGNIEAWLQEKTMTELLVIVFLLRASTDSLTWPSGLGITVYGVNDSPG